MLAYQKSEWREVIEASENGKGAAAVSNRELLRPADRFVKRHLGPRSQDVTDMLHALGLNSLDDLMTQAVPATILDGAVVGRFAMGRGEYRHCSVPDRTID